MLYHEDLAQLIDKCIEKENLNFEIFYGVSNNKWRFWDIEDTQKKIDKALKRNLNKDVQATTSVPEKIEPNPEIIQEAE